MTTKTVAVLNLVTGEEQLYTCSPRQAVISAYALENNLGTQLATGTLNVDVREGKHTFNCGDWSVRK